MKVLVPVKRVVDAYVKIRVKPDGSGVETQNVKMSLNPFDEIAIEAAVRLQEQGIASEILLVTIGPNTWQESLRAGMAIGGDRALLIETTQSYEPLNIAKILAAVAKQESADLIILGKQAIDDDNNQTGQMLAALLNWPQATFASSIDVQGQTVTVTREIDGGLETVEVDLPAIITTDLRLNEPRYATLPNIMKAKKKPLEIKPVSDYGLRLTTHLTTLQVLPPAQRQAGVKVSDVQELVKKLHQEAQVI